VPYIPLDPTLPGITGAFAFRPETAVHMRALAETLLRGPNTLTPGERETIAAFVSSRNECRFCHASHRAAAAYHLAGDYAAVDDACARPDGAGVSPKLGALLLLADKVRVGGRAVQEEDIARARSAGATDVEIHDTVLIAAAFCMFNRYVDGLATWTPEGDDAYDAMGRRMAHEGYVRPVETPA
jgi:uncharacterized peroxidase-related enzyme